MAPLPYEVIDVFTADGAIRHLLDRNLTGPVVMLNLLRFRPTADYTGHPDLAPPAPISKPRRPRKSSRCRSARSQMSPAPSVLSP